MKNICAFFLLALMMQPSLAGPDKILLAAEDDWYPYSAKIGSKAEGRSVDIIKAAYSAVGAELALDVVPFNRGMILTKEGHYAGAFNGGLNDDVRRDYLIPRNPVTLSEQVVVARIGEGFQDRLSFNGKRLTLTLGYTYPTDITNDPKNRIERAVADINNLRKIDVGRADFTIIDRLVFLSILLKEPELKKKLAVVGTLESDTIYVLFSKNDKGKKALTLFDQGMDTIRRNGTLKIISDNWEAKLRQ